MTSHSPEKDRDASWQVFDALRTAPEPLRRSAREAIEAGNQETFITLVTDFFQRPTSGHSGPRIAAEVLDRVDWDWLAGEFLAGPYPSDAEPPPAGPRP
jgi:hypothetical protein